MARLPNVTRDKIRPEDLAKFDEMFKSDYFHIRSTTEGVYSTLLYSPGLADRINALDAFYNLNMSTLPLPLREVVVLTTAREVDSAYVFIRHCPPAREAGIPEDTIRAIGRGTAPQGLSGEEELLVRFSQELIRNRKITDATFNASIDRFGVQSTVEITGLVCYYLLLSHISAAFETEVPPRYAPEPDFLT